MEADTLYREFAGRAVSNAGTRLLLDAGDALELVNASAEAGVPVVEVDAFKLDEAVLPDDIGDFSATVSEGHGCWTDAEKFIRDHADRGLVFEITLGDDPLNWA
jgi:ribosomal protein S12 methylthiotransferase accessory factor YcaO